MSLEGKRIAILAEQDFEDSELYPLKAMKKAGADVIIIGSGSQTSYREEIRRERHGT